MTMPKKYSENLKAAILLTESFAQSEASGEPVAPLTPAELGGLRAVLQSANSDLAAMTQQDERAARDAHIARAGLEPARIEQLLRRGVAMALAVERLERLGGRMVLTAGADYPAPPRDACCAIETMPACVALVGNAQILAEGDLIAVLGDDGPYEMDDYASDTVALFASAGRGIMTCTSSAAGMAALNQAIRQRAKTCVVRSGRLDSLILDRTFREAIIDGALCVMGVQPFTARPSATAQQQAVTMAYRHSATAVLTDAVKPTGAVWTATRAMLDDGRADCRTLCVRNAGPHSDGLTDLKSRGAMPWKEPVSTTEVEATLAEAYG